MWDTKCLIKYKTKKQKLIETDNSLVVSKGKQMWDRGECRRENKVKYMKMEGLTLRGEHTMQNTDEALELYTSNNIL